MKPLSEESISRKRYRAKLSKKGLCIWSCGRKSAKGSGLCKVCAKKNNDRLVAKYRRLHTND